jgi:hypothetical protein
MEADMLLRDFLNQPVKRWQVFVVSIVVLLIAALIHYA